MGRWVEIGGPSRCLGAVRAAQVRDSQRASCHWRCRVRKGLRAVSGWLSVPRPSSQRQGGCALPVWALALPMEGRTCTGPGGGWVPPATRLSQALFSAFPQRDLTSACLADSS